MHKEYWIAIALYVAAVVFLALPFLGIVTIHVGLAYLTLKYLHIMAVIVVVAVMLGQMIAFDIMRRCDLLTARTMSLLSYLDYVTPVGLTVIGFLGYAMTPSLGKIWEIEWLYESSFGVLFYALVSLIMTAAFRRHRYFLEGGAQNPLGAYIAIGSGLVFFAIISAVMVFKAVAFNTTSYLVGITRYFAEM